jgi:hypothetical protein
MSTTPATPYATASIPEAAFLIVRGHPLRAIQPSPDDPRLRAFVFDAPAATDAPLYDQGAPVSARRFFEAVKELRIALFPRALRRAPARPTPRRSPHAHPDDRPA